MGMPITIEINGHQGSGKLIDDLFEYFRFIDKRYSTYKTNSEISRINRGLEKARWSQEMRQIIELCELTKRQTNGYFDINNKGRLDPSGLVKGWAINNAAQRLREAGVENFYIDAGGDIQTAGKNAEGRTWHIGIRSPFNLKQIVKVIKVKNEGVATSGTYVRGQHIYDPTGKGQAQNHIKSLTVIGPNIYDADRYATAAFAMGVQGLEFIEALSNFEGYMIDNDHLATYTSGFERYVVHAK